ncbi:MAG: heat-inducible transcription repressor HrcA [Actinobacteria bacterium]|nr:heat-inducible transcription repressor HrcA [Actinomycetota bacterium]
MYYLEIDERKKLILREVVQRFILTGNPVGSKVIAQSGKLHVSPATVRNEMAALEKMGFLKQPHTSAGREPTNIAYRYYVDILLSQKRPSHGDVEAAEQLFAVRNKEIEGMFKEASILLSELTRTAAMVFAPIEITHIVHRIDLVPLDYTHLVVIVITSMGQVGKRMIELDFSAGRDSIQVVSEFLNGEISGTDISGLDKEKLLDQSGFEGETKDLAAVVLEALASCLDVLEERIFVGGTSNIVREMDCEGREWVQRLLEAIEKQDFILALLKDLVQIRRLTVRIGEENEIRELKRCAFVGTSYPVAKGIFGSLGIVGPTSMDYARAIGIVEYIAENLGRILYRVM